MHILITQITPSGPLPHGLLVKPLKTILLFRTRSQPHFLSLLNYYFLELEALPKLMLMVESSFIEEAIKALYAVSAVVRNNDKGIELFYSEGGGIMIQVM